MKIAIDCRSVFPGRGGIGRYAENLGKRMPEMESAEEYIILTTERQKEKICNGKNVVQWPFACGMIDAFWEHLAFLFIFNIFFRLNFTALQFKLLHYSSHYSLGKISIFKS